MKRTFAALFAIVVLFCMACNAGPDEDTLLLYARASGIYRDGRYAEAAAALSGVGDFAPAVVLRGKAQFLAGLDDDAEKSLRRALSLRPGSVEAGIFLARLLREKGKAAEALNLAEIILSDDPVDIRALRLACDLAMDNGPEGEEAALLYLDRAVEASMETAMIFLYRARNRWKNGRGAAALDDLRKARVLLPPDSPLIRSVANLELIIMNSVN